ncbi:ATP-binding cassette sub-family A member 9-like isoform X4 [Bos indicus x Bos taurus]|uniref:ATP-binding cassette sub-family A member 9-like isoform X4 n=1 Tax=Bos indicus x Bos taurus TaxID=30522 RepID=UPI000F7D28AE|nr:ATP-binding cassette sub-family A member 9-like isoform X4 [Bos indicus x Bos taurus]
MNCFWSLAPAFLRVRMSKRHFSVGQQTRALLGKNFLKKWRMKRETLSEWLFSCLLVLFAHLFSSNLHQVNDFPQLPAVNLGRVDNFNDSDYIIAFAPESKTTQEIMNKLASAPFIKGRTISGWPDEQSMGELELNYSTDAVRVIFNDAFSYHLKFLWGHRIPTMKEHRDHSAHCQIMDESVICEGSLFWEKGFVAFQAAINAAIIEITTNHSVMENLMSVTGINMKILPFVAQAGVLTDFFVFFCVISFSAFIYYVSVSVAQERQFMKPLMTMMGLRESAFWLSWGLMYTGFISITATLMAIIVTYAPVVILTGFTVVFTLFLLYGLSLITLAFLMSVLVKKPFLTGLVVFLLTVFWGSLGFTALYRRLPAALEWTLCLLSPFAFTAGMAQLIHLDYDVNSNIHSDSPNDQYLIIATIFMLVFDALLYLVLTLYLDKILPTEYGRQQPPWFFLKSSSWFQRRRADRAALENDIDPDSPSDDSFEPVSAEFHGKEAIRIRNLKKAYGKGKHEKVEALKGLVLEVYEGQITGILGHSGAGKTTLLNILSGLSAPTSGSVTIYNHSLSEAADLEHISKLTGVCPQANVQFGFLTVRENLRLFAKIKGIQPHEVEQQVQRVLQDLEMGNIQDVLAQNLSSGQKRKLTFGTAILGDPRVLLLDEPTAGSDPLSRHRVWNLLRERKSDHVVLFSTPFMDEADVLADRKVFMSNGRLKCAGSSLFLKRKWGIGYHLSLHLNETCDPDSVTSIVKHHVPDAKLTAQSEEKLEYILPLERTNKFPDLYRDLESCSNQGIENYGVSMTTLNEVFMKLEGKSAFDESGPAVSEQLQSGRNDTGSLAEPEQVVSSFSEASSTVGGLALWRQQLCAVAKVRFLKLKSEKRALLAILLLFGITFGPQLLEHLSYRLQQKSYSWGLSPNMYFLSPGQPPQAPLTRLLVVNRTGSRIDDFIHSLRRQNIDLEVDALGTRNGPSEPSYNGAITVTGNDEDPRFSIACNTKRLNCFPVLMDIISNGLLGMLNSSEHIQTDRSTYFEEHTSNEHEYLGMAFFWIPGAACFTPYIAMGSIGDHKKKVHSQLRISGLYPSAYWFGQALVDVPLYFLILLLMQIMDYVFNPDEFVFIIQSLAVQTLCIIGYVSSLVLLTYVISFIFRHGRKNSGIWSFFFLVVTFFTIVANYLNEYGFLGLFLCTILIPPFTLIGVQLIFSEISPDSVDYLGASEQQVAFLTLLIPYLHFFIFLFILRCLEMKFRKKPMRKDPVFRISPRSSAVFANPEKPEGEDEDVQTERRRTADAVAAPDAEEKPAIVASCLRKEYAGRKKNCFAKRKKKVATRNVSFCVKKGEVIGLLGHNGAGKSTTIKMITGDTRPTAGQLSFALSILGSPGLLLLDEPTTGMDPEGQLQTWQLIRASVRNTARGALLTTHSMAEAEAVCDRVAVMVSGSLRCIGSIQHLKSKFGRDYLLEMKLKSLARLEALHAEVLRIFPQAARQERFASLVVYKLPVEDVHPLSHAFFSLETVKQNFDLEEYSLSQCSLEQVFLELCKEQEWDNSDEEVDLSVRWKLLQEEP